jgi:hypothetical protein
MPEPVRLGRNGKTAKPGSTSRSATPSCSSMAKVNWLCDSEPHGRILPHRQNNSTAEQHPRPRELSHKKRPRQERDLRDAVFRAQRESSETPILKAFCRVAPTLRFSDLAIFAAGVFDLAIVFSSRISSLVHSRRFDGFLAMLPPLAKGVFQTAKSHAPATLGLSTG